MFGLVDGNNFYVSCERVFRPSLNKKPVIVLSNNDGVAIARSDEAKTLGIKMGAPFFKIQREFAEAGVIALSANFPLYGDMSQRMMALAAPLGCGQEIYSIDESFIDLTGIPGDLNRRSWIIRERILRCIGIPCCIGIGHTKTLAKLANFIAKTVTRKPGVYPANLGTVCNFATLTHAERDAVLAATEVKEVWGVGRKLSAQLNAVGVYTALDLANQSPAMVRKRWSVVLERTVRELCGEPCFTLESEPPAKKEIACTRSFGQPVSTLAALKQAVSEFSHRAAEKLRQQNSVAGQVNVFISTSPFRAEKQYAQSVVVPFIHPSFDTRIITAAALRGLQAIFKPGYHFARAGVHLLDLMPATVEQGMFEFTETSPTDGGLIMDALDSINAKYGKGTITLGSSVVNASVKTWQMKQALLTPGYTTCWADVPVVQAN